MKVVLLIYQEVALQNEAMRNGASQPLVITVSVDEKPGVQAISVTAPDLPPDTITRIIKFTPDGKFIKAWGSLGSGKSQFRNPHALVFDSRGRLLVADRVNGRIQVFDQDGKWLTEYRAFNHPSGLFITKDDTLYATDYNSEGQKGTYIGSARTGKVTAFVPDPEAGEGIALGADSVLYAATPGGITRFLPRK